MAQKTAVLMMCIDDYFDEDNPKMTQALKKYPGVLGYWKAKKEKSLLEEEIIIDSTEGKKRLSMGGRVMKNY